jgi:magnesium chelatase family protein
MTAEMLNPRSESCSASAGHAVRGVTTASTSVGIGAKLIQIEVCCTRNTSSFQIVGLTEAAAREARVRVVSALAAIGIQLDEWAITINLAPLDLPKSGAPLDLAIAIGVLAAIGKLPPECAHATLLLGELSLAGSVRAVRGVLPKLEAARTSGVREAIVPAGNACEAGFVKNIEVRVARDLEEVCAHLRGERDLARAPVTEFAPAENTGNSYDFSDIRVQPAARRAIEVAAAGEHNLLMIGPPGAGKTLLARMLPSILPPLTFDEAFEATAVHSVAGLLNDERGMVTSSPFRAPHHSVSEVGLIGGGEFPRPGEVSLAHHGVLFLDELAEFRRSALDALHHALEDGRVCIARKRTQAWFPARPLLVSATNPCPCGYFGHPTRSCRCAPELRQRYLSRPGAALIDRFDVHVSVAPVERDVPISARPGESAAAVRARVVLARTVQQERHVNGRVAGATNATLCLAELKRVAALDSEVESLLEAAARRLGLSAQASLSVRRVARTIADLDGTPNVGKPHVTEAIGLGRMFSSAVSQ